MGQDITNFSPPYHERNDTAQLSVGDPVNPRKNSEYDSIRGILRILRRRWVAFVVIFCLICIAGIAFCLKLTPRYSSTAVIEVNNEHDDTARPESQDLSQNSDALKNEIQTDIKILGSNGLALSVIKQLGLADSQYKSSVVASEKGLPLDQAPLTRERMVQKFLANLKVDSPTDTRLINITFQSPDRAIASDIANTLTSKFIEEALERRHRSTTQSSFWLEKELADLKTQVETSEQSLADYERKTGLAGVELVGGAADVSVAPHNTVTERLFALNQELTSAEASRISAETVYNLVHSQNPEIVLGLGAGSTGLTSDAGIELVRSLRTQEVSLERERAAAAVKYGTNNARLMQIQEQIDSVKQEMQEELKRIDARAENSYQYAKKNEDDLRKEFIKQQSAANVMADSTVQLHVLAQEAYSNRSLYENLFSKLQTANLASGVGATRIDVVEKAVPSGFPSSPVYPQVLAIVLGLGILFGISGAFLRESLDETVRTSNDIRNPSSLPVLGYVPRLQGAAVPRLGTGDSELIYAPLSPFSEAFRSLRTLILVSARSKPTHTILVTSAVGDAGKTVVAYNLAVAFAQQGAKVLLVDADFRHAGLHRFFGVPLSPGLSQVTTEALGSTIPFVVTHSLLPTLSLLPAGESPQLPAEYFESQLFDSFLRESASRFDLVIFDGPPVLPVADASIIAAKVGGTIGVVRSRNTTRSTHNDFVQALRRTNTPILGFVLNDVRNPVLDGFHEYSYSR